MGHCIVAGGKPDMAAPYAGILASDLAVGTSVYLMEDGVATEYLVLNQGIPSGSSLYDASCDGLWLIRNEVIAKMKWNAVNSNVLETSDVQTWLNGDMLSKFDSSTQDAIKQVKIPYRKNGGLNGSDQSGANGLSCKVFLLSGYEVGWTTSNNKLLPVDGAKLDYFDSGTGTSANNKRISYFNGSAVYWWLRSPRTNDPAGLHVVQTNGNDYAGGGTTNIFGVRPALVLPSTALFDKNTLVLKGVV